MSVGSAIRALFGPVEPAVASAYRRAFFDTGAFADLVRAWVPGARAVLEVGCGEGQVTEALVARFPEARFTGIDLTPRVGRLYRGSPAAVKFRRLAVERIDSTFDLVVVCDVLHHVPLDGREAFLAAVARTVRPNGFLVLKEWLRAPTPIHAMVYLSDRLLTQDAVHYCDAAEARRYLDRAMAGVVGERRVGPWRNNAVFLAQHRVSELR